SYQARCLQDIVRATIHSDAANMEHAKVKFEFPVFAQVAAGFAISALVMIGISGSIYKLIAPQGWVVQAFGHSFGLGAALLAAVLGAAAVVWALPGRKPVQRARVSDAVVYSFAAAGLLYVGQMLALGSV
ncbi:MAG: hypothetical protein OEW96_02070, partial [Betaproteobacteria bacterium]|nr:hypothetical protein [Betaproteobacteria bacterium]